MKNFLIISNVVLLALVGYLYYIHFSSGSKPAKASTSTSSQKQSSGVTSTGSSVVGYLDLDSLQGNYEYYKKLKADFERKQQANENEIAAMQKNYQSRAMQLQQKGPTMNQQEQEAAMKEIGTMQQNLQNKKQALDNKLFDDNTKMKDDILKRIQDFLREYNKDGRFSYIFSQKTGFMFYKDSTLDITPDVIKGLNDAYKPK